ncbi:MAG: dTMP kinase [Oligoflexia bacterium]|nr:dTMP kinase [Oligoflexia bacterium]
MPFVTFEGIDGCGKSTLLESLGQHLLGQGLTVQKTREPGGSELGKDLRQILLRTSGEPPCPEAELLIYEADRAQHVQTKIRPWLESGAWVLSDRFFDSSTAFQGAGRKIAQEHVTWLNQFATGSLKPDCTVLIDVPVEVSQQRRKNRRHDRLENEDNTFHESVRRAYLELSKREPKRFFVLDGTKSPQHLTTLLIEELKSRGLLK